MNNYIRLSFNSIRALNLLVTVLIRLFGMFSEKQNESVFVAEIIHISRRIYGTKEKNGKSKFIYYAIADGIFDVLQKTKVGIRTFLNQTRKKMPDQLSFVNFALN